MPSERIQSLRRADRILSVVSATPKGARLADIAQNAELKPTTAHSLLKTLVSLGYVSRSGKLYRLGPRLLQFRAKHFDVVTRPEIIRPVLTELARSTGLNANCNLIVGRTVHVLERVRGKFSRSDMMSLQVHASASGKACLSMMPDRWLEWLLEGDGELKRYTTKTIVDIAQLRRAIDLSRSEGLGFEFEEAIYDVNALAVPLTGVVDGPWMTLSLSGPTDDLSRRTMSTTIAKLERAREAMQATLINGM